MFNGRNKGNVLFIDTLQHFIYGYLVSDHSDSKRKPIATT